MNKKNSEVINLVILGASGNLASNYIYPALGKLWNKGYRFKIYGYGRSLISQKEFNSKIVQKSGIKELALESIFIRGNYDVEGLSQLKQKIDKGLNIFYLAIPTNEKLITSTLDGLKQNGFINQKNRLILEKPFGLNRRCAKRLISKIKKYIKPKLVYPVDHYLTKDLVKNIYEFRFNNVIFKEIWNKKLIKGIEIIAAESENLENRAGYYDESGAIRDMIQNHLLQLLALLMMKKPKKYNQKEFSAAKLKVIKKIKLFSKDKIKIGQYEGYKQETGVNPQSKTETLVELVLQIKNREWRKIPIKMITGKMMAVKKTEIRIIFENNDLVISMAPENEIKIITNNFGKKTELKFNCKEEKYDCGLAYENLLKEIIDGRRINIPTFEEILAQWKITERILKAAEKLNLCFYKPGIWLKKKKEDIFFSLDF